MKNSIKIIVACIGAALLIAAVILVLVKKDQTAENDPSASPQISAGDTLPDTDTPEVSDEGGNSGTPDAGTAEPDVTQHPVPSPSFEINDTEVDDSIYDYDPESAWWLQADSPITSKEPVIPSLTAEEKERLVFKAVDEVVTGTWETTYDGLTTRFVFDRDGTYSITYLPDEGVSDVPENESGTYKVTHTTLEDDYPHTIHLTHLSPEGKKVTASMRFFYYNNTSRTEHHILFETYDSEFTRK